jgi:hypothetical protein
VGYAIRKIASYEETLYIEGGKAADTPFAWLALPL